MKITDWWANIESAGWCVPQMWRHNEGREWNRHKAMIGQQFDFPDRSVRKTKLNDCWDIRGDLPSSGIAHTCPICLPAWFDSKGGFGIRFSKFRRAAVLRVWGDLNEGAVLCLLKAAHLQTSRLVLSPCAAWRKIDRERLAVWKSPCLPFI